uniref:Uncharacterized protein n=1 Tax=Desertifilum tharense IPPAS B-1220 TaxID=1781255 RepID=A0ACD5GV86_9CYAN
MGKQQVRGVTHSLRLGVTLTVGLGLSSLAALFVGRWETASQQTRFQRQIENLTTVPSTQPQSLYGCASVSRRLLWSCAGTGTASGLC